MGGQEKIADSNPDDAAFIAHARTDIPALIAALEESEAARVKAEARLAELEDWHKANRHNIAVLIEGQAKAEARVKVLEAALEPYLKAMSYKGAGAFYLNTAMLSEKDHRAARAAKEQSE